MAPKSEKEMKELKTMREITTKIEHKMDMVIMRVDKLDSIDKNLALILSGLQPYFKDFIRQVKSTEETAETLKNCKNGFDSFTEEYSRISAVYDKMQRDLHDMKVESFAFKRKKTMRNLWNAKINFIKQKYSSIVIATKKGNLYKEWHESELFLPKQFRSHKDSMNPDEREAAHKLGFAKMKTAMTQMDETASNAQKKIDEANSYMLNLFNTREMPNVAAKLTLIWKNHVKATKDKMDREWIPKVEWLRKLPTNDHLDESDMPEPNNSKKTKHPAKPNQSKGQTTSEKSFANVASPSQTAPAAPHQSTTGPPNIPEPKQQRPPRRTTQQKKNLPRQPPMERSPPLMSIPTQPPMQPIYTRQDHPQPRGASPPTHPPLTTPYYASDMQNYHNQNANWNAHPPGPHMPPPPMRYPPPPPPPPMGPPDLYTHAHFSTTRSRITQPSGHFLG